MLRPYKIFADFIFLIHASINLYMVIGAIFAFYFRTYALFHVSVVVTILVINIGFAGCPFTMWERKYRFLDNPKCSFGDSFYGHYVFDKMLGIAVTPTQVKIFLILTKVVPGLLPVGILLGWY